MTNEVFEQTLIELHQHRPFQVFTIELKNGQRLEIDSPLAVSLKDGRAIVQGLSGALHIFDADSTQRFLIGERNALPLS